jgi:hypothetical protein
MRFLKNNSYVTGRINKLSKPAITVLLLSMLALQGCTPVYKTTGDVLVSYGRAEMTPYLLTYDDLDMACATGEAMTPFLVSFESVNANPTRLAVLTNSMAAVCAQERALEHELRYIRAIQNGQAAEARDARTLQKRYSSVAGARLYESYQRVISAYGEATEEHCPRLRSDFDEMVFLVGHLNGVQALLYDGAADNALGLPRNIAAKSAIASRCLDNIKWWGAPGGIRASVWSILPMLAPADTNSWQLLQEAAQQGYASGVRLSSALYAVSAYSADNKEELRRAIREFANNEQTLDRDYAMLNAISQFTVRSISDRMWTEATGERTPFGSLGRFWDDAEEPTTSFDIEDLL